MSIKYFRLYLRATFLGFRRGKSTQNENHALLRVEGVKDIKETRYYLGKRVVYVYKTSSGFRVKHFFQILFFFKIKKIVIFL